jgi:hypothetical protein
MCASNNARKLRAAVHPFHHVAGVPAITPKTPSAENPSQYVRQQQRA